MLWDLKVGGGQGGGKSNPLVPSALPGDTDGRKEMSRAKCLPGCARWGFDACARKGVNREACFGTHILRKRLPSKYKERGGLLPSLNLRVPSVMPSTGS